MGLKNPCSILKSKLLNAMNWFAKKNLIPAEYDWYREACAKSTVLKQPIDACRFVVLDTETTGLDPKTDRILSIGAVAVQNFSVDVADSFETLVKQDQQKAESIAIHEITPGISAQADWPKDVMERFLNFLRGSVIIGHYVEFDHAILSASCKRQLGFGLENQQYDTMRLLRRTDNHFAYSNLNKPSDFELENVCNRFNIPIADRHTAMGDALATALLFTRQLKKLQKRGIKTVRELLKR